MSTDQESFADFQSDLFDDDDTELFATPFTRSKANTSSANCAKSASTTTTNTTKITQSSYLKKVESDAIEECNNLIREIANQVPPSVIRSDTNYEYYTLYFHCPICLTEAFNGGKTLKTITIQHIKVCANKHLMSPKDVVSLLKQCPKTRRQKLSGFKTSKPKNVIKKRKEKLDKNYELQIYNEQYKQELIQKRVSRLLMKENLCKKLTENSEVSLPQMWKLSHLNNNSQDYVIDEFSEYFQFENFKRQCNNK